MSNFTPSLSIPNPHGIPEFFSTLLEGTWAQANHTVFSHTFLAALTLIPRSSQSQADLITLDSA